MTSTKLKISIVIPTRNQAAFITRCLDQCLAQNVEHCQIIVQDGASTDNTPAILKQYGNRIEAISEPDAGQSDALDKGIARSDGDIIAWINSDDFYPTNDVLSRVIKTFESDPTIDIVYGHAKLVNVSGNVLRTYPVQRIDPLSKLLTYPVSPLCQPAVFFKRELYNKTGGIDRNLHLTMDHDLWLRMFPLAIKTQMIQHVLAHVTSHPDAKSVHQAKQQFQELWHVKQRYIKQYQLRWFDRLHMRLGHWKNMIYAATQRFWS